MRRLPFYYGWIIVAVTFVTMGIGVNARTSFSLFFAPIVDEFGWDRGVTAGAFSFGFLVSAILSPLMGRLMDRSGPRTVMELGVLLMGAGLLLAPLTTQPWHLYATIGCLVGAGSICLGYSGQSLFLPNWFVKRRGPRGRPRLRRSRHRLHHHPAVGAVADRPDRLALGKLGDGHSGAGRVLVPLNLLLRKRPEDIGLLPDGDAAPTAATIPPPSNIVDPAWVAVDWTLGLALRTARFWWISLGYFCGLYVWYAVQVHQTKYLVEIGFSSTSAAWALGLVSLIGIPGQIALGYLSDRIGREWVWAIASLGFAVCFAALIALQYAPTLLLVYVMVVVQGFFGYGYTSIMGAVVAEIFHGKHFGTIFGTIGFTALAGGAAGPWVTGILHDIYGDYTLAFIIGIAVSALSAAAIWLAAPRHVRAVAGRMHRIAKAA